MAGDVIAVMEELGHVQFAAIDSGHFLAEKAPEATLAQLEAFL